VVENTTTGFKYYGWIGFLCGALALGISVLHFYTGPLVKEPTLKENAIETVVSIKQKALKIFKRQESLKPKENGTLEEQAFNLDQKLDLASVILGLMALIFASIAFIRHENIRASGMAGAFGVGAILFQFLNWAIAFAAVIVIIGFTFFSLSTHNKDI